MLTWRACCARPTAGCMRPSSSAGVAGKPRPALAHDREKGRSRRTQRHCHGMVRAMRGLMQESPLTVPMIFRRAERVFPDKTIVSVYARGERQRVTYGEWADRTRRLGGVLDELGVSADGRVGTFAWNTSRHLELYFAAPCTGRVLHTLNLRLFPDDLTYIINHAEDEVIFTDRSVA